MSEASKAQNAYRFGVLILLGLLALDAGASTWCWKEGLLDVFEALLAEGCPLNHIQVRMCGIQMPTGNLIIAPASMDCPAQANEGDKKIPTLDWRDREPYGKSARVVFIEGIAPTAERAESGSGATPRDTKPNDGIIRDYTVVYNVPLGPAPSSLDRHVGKLVGLLGLAAICAGVTAVWKIGRRKFRTGPIAPELSGSEPVTAPANAALDDLYVQALDELDAGKPDRAVWARALGESAGNDKAAHAAYIKARVAQLAGTRRLRRDG